jgi:putative peptidoglycan lipid II flippase
MVRLQKWKNESVNRSIFVAIVIVGFFTVISKLVSMIKDLFVARSFGVSSELDAFLVSFIVPSLVINLVGSSFNASLIPAYIEVRTKDGPDAARELLSQVSGRLLMILLGCTGVLAIVGPVIVSLTGSRFDAATLQLCQALYFIALPAVVIAGMSTIWSAILNAEDQFALASVIPAVVPLAMIVGLVAAPADKGVYALSISMISGFTIQAVVVGYALRQKGLSLMPHFRKTHPMVNSVMRQLFPAVTGGIFANSTDLVDQTMAAMLGAGSVSVLNYGSKLTSFAIGIASVAISSAVLPYFSRLVANKDWDGVKRTYRIYSLLILFATGMVTIFVILFSETLIRAIFQRGAFTAEDTKIVSYVQNLGILELPFFALSILTVRLLSALKGNAVLAQAAVINGVVNISMNYFLSPILGVAGIALSTTCVYVVSFTFLYFSLQRRLRRAQEADQKSAS